MRPAREAPRAAPEPATDPGPEGRPPAELSAPRSLPPLDWLGSLVRLAEKIAAALDRGCRAAAPARAGPPAGPGPIMTATAGWVRRRVVERILLDRGFEPTLAGRLLPSTGALPALPAALGDRDSAELLPSTPPAAPIDWLGTAHELLSSLAWQDGRLVVRATARKRAGLFFTPPEVAALMVDRLCAGLEGDAGLGPERIASLRLVDPACGSGAFLIAAYRKLLALASSRRSSRCDPGKEIDRAAGARSVPASPVATLRRSLLQSVLHGLDLDETAVELTRCNLALAYLEAGGAPDSIPPLDRTVRRADALLEGPVAPGAAGRFDGVLCNPPYRFGENIDPSSKAAMRRTYRCASARQWDTWALFLELGLRRLLRSRGFYSYIVPDALLARRQATVVREMLLRHGPPHEVWHLGPVFRGTVLRAGPTAGRNTEGASRPRVSRGATGVSAVVVVGREGARPVKLRHVALPRGRRTAIPFSLVRADPWMRILGELQGSSAQARWRLICEQSDPLESYLVHPGIGRGEERAKRPLPDHPAGRFSIPVLGGGEALRPLRILPRRRYIDRLSTAKQTHYRSAARLLAAKTGERLVVARAPRDRELAFLQTIYALHVRAADLAFLEGWLNCDLCNWIIRVTITAYKRLMPQLTQDEIRTLPVPRLPVRVKNDISRLVDQERGAGTERIIALLAEVDRRIIGALGCVPLAPEER